VPDDHRNDQQHRDDADKEACDYFAMARDSRNYSEAFRYYRSEWVEQNIGWIFGIVTVLQVVPMVVGHIRKIKWEVDNA